MQTHNLFGGAATLALVLSLAGSAHAQQATPEEAAKSNAGKACTVTSGPNAGKTGTVTIEEGTSNEWCEGSWGGTQCTSGKCNIAKVVAGGGRLSGLTTADRQILQSYASAAMSGREALTTWATKYQAKVVSKSGSAVTLSISGRTLVIDGDVKGLAGARIR